MADNLSIFNFKNISRFPFVKILFFFLFLYCCDYILGNALKDALLKSKSFWGAARSVQTLKKVVPGIIMGNSRAGAYAPEIIAERMGVDFFNATSPAQSIFYNCILLDYLIKNNLNLKYIIYEIDKSDLELEEYPISKEPSEMLSFLYEDSIMAREVLCTINPLNYYRYKSRLMQVNGVVTSVLFDRMFSRHVHKHIRSDGFEVHDGVVLDGNCEGQEVAYYHVDNYKIKLLKKFIRMAKENNIKLVFLTSPVYLKCTPDYSAIFDAFKSIAKECDVAYYSFFNDFQEKELFYDINHLNMKGAYLYTNHIIDIIRSDLL